MQTSEYRKQVTERLIGMLESGTAPWQKPWDAGIAAMNRPHNFNGRPYHGVNALMLWCTAIDKGYEDPRWLTFNQIKNLGGHVNKGEKAQVVEYWQWTKDVENPETGEKETVELDHPRVYRAAVFNADQCSGLPPLERPVQQWKPHERADRIVAANGVQVTHNSDQGAFYSPGGDYICLPPKESFATEDAYYSTLLHEVGHSTGHPSRLNRDFGGSFGSEGYAKEELRAELASTFLCGELGIATTGSDEQHAAYVKSWVSALKDDYNEIFRAAADAEKICNYLYEREAEYLKEQEQGLIHEAQAQPEPVVNGAGETVLQRMTPEDVRLYDFPFIDAQGERRITSRIINEIERWDYSRIHPTNEQLLEWADIGGIDYNGAVFSKDELLIKAKERLAELDAKLNMPITTSQSEFLDYLGVKHSLDITCNDAENLIKNAHITTEQIGYAEKKGFYKQIFYKNDFSYLNFCNSAKYSSSSKGNSISRSSQEESNMAFIRVTLLIPSFP